MGGRHYHHGRTRRFFRSGDLALVLLALVAEQPRHGYELMAEMDTRFGPAYQPSPGSIYPALTALEEEALLEAHAEGDRKVYKLTDDGREALANRAEMLAAIEARTGVTLSGNGSFEPALGRLTAQVRAVAGEVDPAQIEVILSQAAERIGRLRRRKRRTT